ncbi:hydrogenase formation protein HypD [candidate division WOR-3 bacterium]|nr:hydrogenase formation protein HypD [candidate division WOR-3 bacterium]
MKYIDEFSNQRVCLNLAKKIEETANGKDMTFMEVCGTHTVEIFKSGIKSILPKNVRLLSGPGCPVCVTPNSQIDKMIAYARRDDVIITTFGDMMKVPGSIASLSKEKALGRDIRVVYSVNEAVKLAENNPSKKIIFFGIGFETTAPTVAASLKDAKERKLKNYFVLSAHKLIPPAIKVILESGEVRVDGFLLPGHVSVIIGRRAYDFIAQEHRIPCAVAGFEPLDILRATLCLVKQIDNGTPAVENCYKRSVKEEGNRVAKELMNEVFEIYDSEWRGLGVIPNSGLKIREEYSSFDVEKNIEVEITLNSQLTTHNSQCICGEILRGIKTPVACKLFGRECTPENPIGPCMVSSEGTCAAYYKYGS